VIAVIPTLGLSPWLPALVDQLVQVEQAQRVLLVSNRPLPDDDAARLIVDLVGRYGRCVEAHGRYETTIYDSWRFGIDRAADLGTTCAVLNDDVEIKPHALRLADAACWLDAAIVGLDYVGHRRLALSTCHGTYRHGGIPGWAFVVDPARVPATWDSSYEWWYGDDDLVFSVEAAGHPVAIMEGAHVLHHTSTTEHAVDDDLRAQLEAAKGRDQAKFTERWGHR
jgi:hypothetical protein